MNKIIYLDDNNNIVTEKNATHFIAHEYSDNGILVNEIFGVIHRNKLKQKNYMNINYTDEEIEFLNSFVNSKGNHPFKK